MLEINLQPVVVVITIRILIGQAAQVRIGLEEVERVLATHVEPGCDAGGELVAHKPTEIRRAGSQRLCKRARNALVQIQNEGCVAEALRIGKRRLISERPESGLENGQWRLTRQAVIGEGLPFPASDIDVEVVLRLNELTEEAVLKDVDLLQVLAVPHVSGFVAHVAHLERGVLRELALNAQTPILNVGRPQIRIDVVAAPWRREGALEDWEPELRREDRDRRRR